MLRVAVALLLGCLPALTIVTARADGVGEMNYNYVDPPAYLASSNTPPTGAEGIIPFRHGVSAIGNVTTSDTQAGIDFDPGAIPPESGQTGARVSVFAVAHFPPLVVKGALLDGNAYGFRVTYIPSGQPVTHLQARALVTLVYPRTPIGFLRLAGNKWKTLCPFNTVIHTSSTVSCYERSIAPEVAVLRGVKAPPRAFSYYVSAVIAVFLFATVLTMIPYIIWKNFIRRPAGTR